MQYSSHVAADPYIQVGIVAGLIFCWLTLNKAQLSIKDVRSFLFGLSLWPPNFYRVANSHRSPFRIYLGRPQGFPSISQLRSDAASWKGMEHDRDTTFWSEIMWIKYRHTGQGGLKSNLWLDNSTFENNCGRVIRDLCMNSSHHHYLNLIKNYRIQPSRKVESSHDVSKRWAKEHQHTSPSFPLWEQIVWLRGRYLPGSQWFSGRRPITLHSSSLCLDFCSSFTLAIALNDEGAESHSVGRGKS